MRAEDLLPEGVDHAEVGGTVVRKGTVGAFLHNVATWRDPAASEAERAAAEQAIRAAVPTLRDVGLLDVFEARDERLRALIAQG